MAASLYRDWSWALNAAGVASVTALVTTIPVAMPRSSAFSRMVLYAMPSTVRPTVPLLVLIPVAMAVAPAAESVTRLDALCVLIRPVTGIL